MEWLRYRGYFVVACPFFQGQKAENVRLLCPIPHELSLSGLKQVAGAFRSAGIFGGPPKLDSLATLKLAELLIRHSEEYSQVAGARPFPGIRMRGKNPSTLISGISVTNYQSLGSAKAVSAISTIALPVGSPSTLPPTQLHFWRSSTSISARCAHSKMIIPTRLAY